MPFPPVRSFGSGGVAGRRPSIEDPESQVPPFDVLRPFLQSLGFSARSQHMFLSLLDECRQATLTTKMEVIQNPISKRNDVRRTALLVSSDSEEWTSSPLSGTVLQILRMLQGRQPNGTSYREIDPCFVEVFVYLTKAAASQPLATLGLETVQAVPVVVQTNKRLRTACLFCPSKCATGRSYDQTAVNAAIKAAQAHMTEMHTKHRSLPKLVNVLGPLDLKYVDYLEALRVACTHRHQLELLGIKKLFEASV